MNRLSGIRETGAAAVQVILNEENDEVMYAKVSSMLLKKMLPNVLHVSIYVQDESDLEGMDAVVVAYPHHVTRGDNRLLIHQLSPTLRWGRKPVVRFEKGHYELYLTLQFSSQVLGILVLHTVQPLCDQDVDDLQQFAGLMALGLGNRRQSSRTERCLTVLNAIVSTTKKLGGISQEEQVYQYLVEMAVNMLGFDRATVFVSQDDGQVHAYFANIRQKCVKLETVPTIDPPDGLQDLANTSGVPGMWIPIRLENRRIASLLVDNLYTFDLVPDEITRGLVNMCAQVGLVLDNIRLMARFREMAQLDDLTRLYRPVHFSELAQNAIDNIVSNNVQGALLVMDLDHFKQVNDTLGHQMGDAVIVEFASIISTSITHSDLACRFGGDEFIVFKSVDDLREIPSFIHHLHKMADETWQGRFSFPLRVSIGVARVPDDGTEYQQLVQIADDRMYQEKREHKNALSFDG